VPAAKVSRHPPPRPWAARRRAGAKQGGVPETGVGAGFLFLVTGDHRTLRLPPIRSTPTPLSP
jgi:hypothetical protein